MASEPKIDRIEFQEDIRDYFRPIPRSPFLKYDAGLVEAPAEDYPLFSQCGTIDTLIVKVSTSVVTHKVDARTDYNLDKIASDLSRIRREYGLKVLLVTSGAIGLGRKARIRWGHNIPESEKEGLEQKRTDAVIGQPLLYFLWQNHFSRYGQGVVQRLVTHEDLSEANASRLIDDYGKILGKGAIPIINEDDQRSIEEIDIMLKGERVFRDNDGLASLHARMLGKAGYNPLLVLLSNTDGIYTAESFQSGEYTPIRTVINSSGLEDHALPISSPRGRGGMISKIEVGRELAQIGISTVLANGQYANHDARFQKGHSNERRYKVLDAILEGRVVGTRFVPEK